MLRRGDQWYRRGSQTQLSVGQAGESMAEATLRAGWRSPQWKACCAEIFEMLKRSLRSGLLKSVGLSMVATNF